MAELSETEKTEPETRQPIVRKHYRRGEKHSNNLKRRPKITLKEAHKPNTFEESNKFTIPKSYPISREEITNSNRGSEPYQIDLYKHTEDITGPYEQWSDEVYPTFSSTRNQLTNH